MGSTNILTPPNTTTEFRNENQQGNARKKHIKGFLLDLINTPAVDSVGINQWLKKKERPMVFHHDPPRIPEATD